MIIIYKTFNFIFISLFFITILISIFCYPFYLNKSNIKIIEFIDTGDLLWPTPGISRINSYYGKRIAPTNGASTFHKGIDIGAPEGFEFIACSDGIISFANFLGGGGYTITLTDIDKSIRRN